MSDDHLDLSHAESAQGATSTETFGDGPESDRWAFGTGFHDPLHGVDTAVPAGIDGPELAAYCLALGDDALICAQRLGEWCSRAPELEEEMALANIGLDLLGQTRLLYSRAGQADGSGRGEDAYAYLRDAPEFCNVRLAELPNGDFAFSIARLLVFSSWRLALFERLVSSADPVLAAIAAKGVNELAYHREWAAAWTVRLGDGTEESHRRMRQGLAGVAPYIAELYTTRPLEARAAAAGFGVAPAAVREEVQEVLRQVADKAGLTLPEAAPLPGTGRDGDHTEHLRPLLAELQSVARAHPEAIW